MTSLNEKTYLNISGYKFIPLTHLADLKQELLTYCNNHHLIGTILLSPEGINVTLAGTPTEVHHFIDQLNAKPEFSDLTFKESFSETVPFSRMLVRLKKEIIAFGVKSIDPAKKTSPHLPAETLKEWLDAGKEVLLLDTRNDYEVRVGTFKGAEHIDLKTFRAFPKRCKELLETHKDKPVVTFCTGGVRCEKAAPLMEEVGFEEVYQLDGGILTYFEKCGNAHWEGDCFVFDKRVAIAPTLEETFMKQCYACRQPLSDDEVKSPLYEETKSCPYCYERTKSSH